MKMKLLDYTLISLLAGMAPLAIGAGLGETEYGSEMNRQRLGAIP